MKTKFGTWVFCFLLSALVARADDICKVPVVTAAHEIHGDTLGIVVEFIPDTAAFRIGATLLCSDGSVKKRDFNEGTLPEKIQQTKGWYKEELLARGHDEGEIDVALRRLQEDPKKHDMTLELNGRRYTAFREQLDDEFVFSVKADDDAVPLFEKRAPAPSTYEHKQITAGMKSSVYRREKQLLIDSGQDSERAARDVFEKMLVCQTAVLKLKAAGIQPPLWGKEEEVIVDNLKYPDLKNPMTGASLEAIVKMDEVEPDSQAVLTKELDTFLKRKFIAIGTGYASRFVTIYERVKSVEAENGVPLDRKVIPHIIARERISGHAVHLATREAVKCVGEYDPDLVMGQMIADFATRIPGQDSSQVRMYLLALVEKIKTTLDRAPAYPAAALHSNIEPGYTARIGFDLETALLRIRVESPSAK
ncbi:MAG: hypothetical protein HY459_02510 [Parcubacteria group bacterium]|nr:hypothetical protein [Parcubacteria group bacterium]